MNTRNQCALIQLVIFAVVLLVIFINSCTLVYLQGSNHQVTIDKKAAVELPVAEDDDELIERVLDK